ncbi:helix-turn-helix domain-containing protein [Cohnella sp. 56]|uniref:helix-turn-helix domain-containing protein n=1 Tax=Cohnella sp. 56 TaxID=3113722 RepID=UPI0030E77FED
MDIRIEFGSKIRELRARCGMSQEMLANRAGLDRTYISGVERGQRNISIDNIQRIAAALRVSMAYLFSGERFSTNAAYQQKEFALPFKERFKYSVDYEKRILSFQVKGLQNRSDVDYMNSVLMGVCSAYGKSELSILVDHRDMKSSDGEPVVYSPEVAERSIIFQRNLLHYSNKAIVLCNSEFMVQQLIHVTQESGIPTTPLFGQDKEMIARAYELLDITGNDLIKAL